MIFPAEDIFLKAPRATPLYSAVASESEANAWTSVNGLSVARVMTSVDDEYAAAKSSAVVTDLGALARATVAGPDAAAFLSRLTTAPALQLKLGESARGLMLDDAGYVVDLAEVSRASQSLFLLTTPTGHPRRLQLAARGLNVEIADISNEVAALGVFGPKADDALEKAGLRAPAQNLTASAVQSGVETSARPVQFGVIPGVELLYPRDEALTLWQRLRRRGGARPIGADALEVLRIESGAPRPGVDFVPAARTHAAIGAKSARLPSEIGLPHLAPVNAGWFNGRRALRHSAGAETRRLTVLAIDDDRSTPGAAVFAKGKTVGRVTSCAWSPALRRVVAFADVSATSPYKDYEISVPSPTEGRVAARLLSTPESALAEAHRSDSA
ncbi:MAG: glycine cleavage T C-terminal barrel domain-containing protein [Pseudomonadota bacterium]